MPTRHEGVDEEGPPINLWRFEMRLPYFPVACGLSSFCSIWGTILDRTKAECMCKTGRCAFDLDLIVCIHPCPRICHFTLVRWN